MCRVAFLAGLATVGLAVAGCGGSTGNGNSARIRAIDLSPNGGSATVFINSGAANGTQNFEQNSSYLYLQGGTSSITFDLSSNLDLSTPTLTRALANGDAYTVVVIGRADAEATTAPSYPNIIFMLDQAPAPPAGDAEVRIINAGPDAGAVNVTSGSTAIDPGLPYGVAEPYMALPAGSSTIKTTDVSTGITLVNKTVSFSAGQTYTLYIVEPTLAPTTTSNGVYDYFVTNDAV